MICDLLSKGLVILNEDNSQNTIESVLDDILIRYNKHRGDDIQINKKEVNQI